MDFWARLIGGVSSSPAVKQPSANNPQQRLARFRKVYAQLLQTWRASPSPVADAATADAIRRALQRLTSLLHEESRTPVPHPCLSFASSSRMYDTISQVASTSHNEGVIREAISAFGTLVDSEEEEFLRDGGFAKSLMAFVGRVSGANAMMVGADAEAEVVELLFGIAAKIRLQPDILPMWFTSHGGPGRQGLDGAAEPAPVDDAKNFEGSTHEEDFPLFYLLIGYVHHEGRVGDFARTGLLYIIESASSSEELERWLVESDLATLMASGLGALYSQLSRFNPPSGAARETLTDRSRKLVMSYTSQELPTILALSDYSGASPTFEAETSTSSDFQTHLDTFLSYLVFWQDVLEHCNSVEVKQTLLDHFHVLFLQQLLYPSLLESSDIDGGSSVAVLTYLRRILDSLDHPDLIHLILHYLLALPDQTLPKPASSYSARRRKSLELLTQTMNGEDNPTPALFNLVDLIVGSLRSPSQQTITATLRLVSVILRRHHRYAISTLLRTSPTAASSPERTIGAVNKEMDLLFSLVADIGGDDDFDESYENHVKDGLNLLESHPCAAALLAAKGGGAVTSTASGGTSIVGGTPRDVHHHVLRLEDPLLKALLGVLSGFFTNTIETNLSLTQAIVDLASCGYMRLEGWLLVDPAKYEFLDETEDAGETGESQATLVAASQPAADPIRDYELAQQRASRAARRTPSWSPQDVPPLLAAIQALMEQLHAYRAEIPRFDAYLSERKQAFQVSEELNEALSSAPQHVPSRPQSTAATPTTTSKPPPLDSISQRMFAERNPSSLSRSSSPRGRQQAMTPVASPTPKALQAIPPNLLGTPTPSRDRGGRAFSPSPLRSASLSSTPPKAPSFAATTNEDLARKVAVPPDVKMPFAPLMAGEVAGSSGASSVHSDSDGRGVGAVAVEGAAPSLTVSHLLTNVVVLQEFLLELAALIQVRASLFGDVRFA
ncbi:MAG: hypothetical protein M1832_006015 [Thelocarpon impressellum]|nr:MAG: hypothetical protein M1832_006015 [Thelocarpon impressellum]